MVISQKISEKIMDNRGSKSDFQLKLNQWKSVKEQRVDGKKCTDPIHLRCTLTGFERNYQIKVPSNQIINTRNLMTLATRLIPNGWFITGFVDAEGCFMISVRKNSYNKKGYIVEAIFSITQHKRDLALLQQIQAYFGGIGSISKHGKDTYRYVVTSIKQISDFIIPHFDKYPLMTQKLSDYLLFNMAVNLIKNKEHLTIDGFKKVLSIRASMNWGLSDELKEAFPNIIPEPRPSSVNQNDKRFTPFWIAGFTTGEGCFLVKISRSTTHKVGKAVKLNFYITQHTRDALRSYSWKV